MISPLPPIDPGAPIIVIDIGNSTIDLAIWSHDELKGPLSVENHDQERFREALEAHIDTIPNKRPAAISIASVVPQALEWVIDLAGSRIDRNALIIGQSIELPMDLHLTDADRVGVDRICAAAAAYDTVESTCVIVDFGTAVTVDLVNNEGTFMGGAILPGLKLQIQALHDHTAVLPHVEPKFLKSPVGRNTEQAIQNGVCRGLVGAVRALVEAYAAELNHWPQVIATGGDLELLVSHCDFLDTTVKHLTLRGVGMAYKKHLLAHGV